MYCNPEGKPILNIFLKELVLNNNLTFTSLPNKFILLAKTSDGCIEAMKHTILPWEGWMWHPERDKKFDKKLIQIAKKMFSLT